ncbi:PREDICTED: fragile X mental retardation 1 neighbor protein-like [Elephantulus edwardii]|uniref:fragile X mental retardation 1 neighbor protein-like n=1 Tax=Elephantulus edwardii TaxID=28737 RepID=UPI0003F078AA|nr:PREDICTED: fragile X mental retardation 1 neighbor protein-like [Elephantulus edwardii]
METESVVQSLYSFFSPTTCFPREDQELKPCKGHKNFNQGECLKSQCCYSETSKLNCFMPVKDVPTQMFRVLALVVSSMIILGFLPIYCCSFCRRSKWANSLQRKVNRFLKKWKKPKTKMKRETKRSNAEEEEGLYSDENEEPTGVPASGRKCPQGRVGTTRK